MLKTETSLYAFLFMLTFFSTAALCQLHIKLPPPLKVPELHYPDSALDEIFNELGYRPVSELEVMTRSPYDFTCRDLIKDRKRKRYFDLSLLIPPSLNRLLNIYRYAFHSPHDDMHLICEACSDILYNYSFSNTIGTRQIDPPPWITNYKLPEKEFRFLITFVKTIHQNSMSSLAQETANKALDLFRYDPVFVKYLPNSVSKSALLSLNKSSSHDNSWFGYLSSPRQNDNRFNDYGIEFALLSKQPGLEIWIQREPMTADLFRMISGRSTPASKRLKTKYALCTIKVASELTKQISRQINGDYRLMLQQDREAMKYVQMTKLGLLYPSNLPQNTHSAYSDYDTTDKNKLHFIRLVWEISTR